MAEGFGFRTISPLLFISILAAFSCKSPEFPREQQVVVAMDSAPQSLDPRKGTDLSSQKIHQLIYNSLVRKDRSGNMVPGLIAEYRYIDTRTLEIRIKDHIRFHDGRSLSSRDIKYTYDSLMDPGFSSLRKSAFRSIRSIEALDSSRLLFHLNERDASLFQNLVIGILPHGTTEEDFEHQRIVGSGPFRFHSMTENSVFLLPFKENEENRNDFSSLKLRFISDPVTRGLELKKGSVDIAVNNIPFDSLEILRSDQNLRVMDTPGGRYSYIAFNFRHPVLQISSVRRAICQGIHRQRIIDYLYHGFARKAESILPPGNRYFHRLPDYEYDPQYSRCQLEKLGYSAANPLELEIKVSSSGTGKKLAMFIARDLREVHVHLNLVVQEFSSFYNDIKRGNFQLYILSWVGISDPDIFYYVFHSGMVPPKGANRGYFYSPEVDRLTVDGRNTYDPVKRGDIYRRLQMLIHRELPYVSLWTKNNVAVVHHRIKGFELYAFGDFYPLSRITLR